MVVGYADVVKRVHITGTTRLPGQPRALAAADDLPFACCRCRLPAQMLEQLPHAAGIQRLQQASLRSQMIQDPETGNEVLLQRMACCHHAVDREASVLQTWC